MRKFKIAIPEECSIPAIYDAIAVAAGKDPKACQYDCRYVRVAQDIFDAYTAYMTDCSRGDSIGALWLMYGPKVDETLIPGEVVVEGEFFVN